MGLTKQVYMLVEHFPSQEKYGLQNQIQRAAVSIPANIAEGAGRESQKELGRFLSIAVSSSFELETLLILACELGFLDKKDLELVLNQLEVIQKQINTFIQKIKHDER